MKCPFCDEPDTKVIDSRPTEEGKAIRRRRECPACGKQRVERLIAGGARIIFKGSGFYETDYKHNDGKISGEAPSKPAKKAG